jgi:HPt (histidine-containing phosphotransfer) domain-containing protein
MEYKFIKTDYLEMVAGGDTELLKELVGMFRDQVTGFNSEMNELYKEGNYHALGCLAHKAKSSVAIMGMESLSNMLMKFESEALEGKNKEIYESYISRFENDTRSALSELDVLVKNL